MKIKVYGAGSIGNHLTQASRTLGHDVVMCDIDPAALERTRTDIYPTRYGAWDDAIGLYLSKDAPRGEFDLIIIGTPPDSHIALAMDALKEKPRAIMIEKPVCPPDLIGAQELMDQAKAQNCQLFVGYDHVVGFASVRFEELLKNDPIGDLQTLDVEFREHWGGIFGAHPWLAGPHDSYLGFWKRGGGSAGEHSHAFNLWQHFSHLMGKGRVRSVNANLEYINDGTVDYDSLCLANIETEDRFMGRVVQDVVTKPTRKWARVQGTKGYIEWICGYEPGCDAVILGIDGQDPIVEKFTKTRPDDFIAEMKHINAAMNDESGRPDLLLSRGLDTMMVVAAAHKSAQSEKKVTIDWSAGYTESALK